MLKHPIASLALCLAVLAAPLPAQQLNPAHIPADAQWLVFIGGNNQNLLVRQFLELLPQDKIKSAQLQCIRKYGFDPETDVKSMVVFSDSIDNLANDHKEPDGTFVAQVHFDRLKMTQAIIQAAGKEYQSTQYQGHTIHQIPVRRRDPQVKLNVSAKGDGRLEVDLGEDWGITAPYMVLDKPDLLIAGANLERLKKTLDVIDGRSPSLAGAKGPTLIPKLPEGTYLLFAASNAVWMKTAGFDAEKITPAPPQRNSLQWNLQLADRGAALIMGEADNHTFISTRLCMQDASTASNLKMTVEGLRAMMALSNVNGQTLEAQMMRYLMNTLNTADIAVDQDELRLTLRVPNDQIKSMIQMAKSELALKTKIETENK